MTVDYVDLLRQERTKAHSVFHLLIGMLPKTNDEDIFLFFEGDEDPAFYMPHVRAQVGEFIPHQFMCYGRAEVVKVYDLIRNDGRALTKSFFFIDKDHNDIVGVGVNLIEKPEIFQTTWYSIENYLVHIDVVNAYWTEILHLETTDERKNEMLRAFTILHEQFLRKMTLIMAIVLLGRGILGSQAVKLNLNNITMDLIFKINYETLECKYKKAASESLSKATNTPSISGKNYFPLLKKICRDFLETRKSKEVVRGKYELDFFVRFLSYFTTKLASKSKSAQANVKRATPALQISQHNAVEILSPRISCPPDLLQYLRRRMSILEEQRRAA
jgi:hypothetical protein